MSSLYSWSQFALRTAGAAVGVAVKPGKLIFVVTKRCHSKCVYCDIWKVKDTPGGLDGELSLDEIRRVASANSWLQWIDFTGGEPTDHPDFTEVVRSFSEACPDLLLVHFPTNGIATKRIAEVVGAVKGFLKARLVVTVSIDGPPEMNDRLRGIRNDFVHAVDSFAAVRRILGPENTYVGMTLHAHSGSCGMRTAEVMERTYAAVDEALAERGEAPLGRSAFHLNIPHISQHYYGNTDSKASDGFGGPAHRAEVAEALTLAARKSDGKGSLGMGVVERVYRSEAMRYLATGHTGIACSALLQTAYLSEKGQLYPCTIWDKPLGSVRDTGYAFMPLIQKAWREGVRKAVAEAKCPNCWTPCEAYPAILASPMKSVASLLRRPIQQQAGLNRPEP